MRITIVIPAYNEAKRLPDSIDQIIEYFRKKGVEFEVIIVNDGSTDSTKELVLSKCHKYNEIHLASYDINMGKGYAVNTGVSHAKGDIILFTDADLSTPIEEYEKLKKGLDEGFDVAIGSRRIKGSEIKIKQPIHRRMAGRIFSILVEIFLIRGITDTQCGFKLFKREIAEQAFRFQRINGFCFDVEILYILKKMKIMIKQVPVTWIDSAAHSKLNLGKEFFRTFNDLTRIKFIH